MNLTSKKKKNNNKKKNYGFKGKTKDWAIKEFNTSLKHSNSIWRY